MESLVSHGFCDSQSEADSQHKMFLNSPGKELAICSHANVEGERCLLSRHFIKAKLLGEGHLLDYALSLPREEQ